MAKHDSLLIDLANSPSDMLPVELFAASQVREIDRRIIEDLGIPGLVLMRRAAEATCQALRSRWPRARSVRIYCGSGNNAADGYIVAGILAEQKFDVEVAQVGDVAKLSQDGKSAYQYCEQSGASILQFRPASSDHEAKPDVIVDALLGTGFTGALREGYDAAIEEINQIDCPVIAVDVPSGLLVDSGSRTEGSVQADVTVTFIALKRGFFTGDGPDLCGDLYLAPLVDSDAAKKVAAGNQFDGWVERLDLASLRSSLPLRAKNSHKFRYGHVLVIGGNQGMGGAATMTALAAIRSGAGMVSLATHPTHAKQLVGLHPELMIRGVSSAEQLSPLIANSTIIAIGPGLGRDGWASEMFDTAMATDLPMVVDADGLNLLGERAANRTSTTHRENWVLTPHPGEASRLLGTTNVQADRFESGLELQKRYGGIAVLKGAGTLVVDAQNTGLCAYGNPGMSTAGMGDVLCGVIAGLLAQTNDLELAARLGVVVHSAAADRCVGRDGMRGLMATDLIPEVRRLLNDV